MAKRTKCLIANCGRKVEARGLCLRHYHRAQRTIARGEASWAQLVRRRLATSGREPNPFLP